MSKGSAVSLSKTIWSSLKCKKIISKFTDYTLLNTAKERIYHECVNAQLQEACVTNPPPIKEGVRTNMSKFWRFHKSAKHNIDNCFHLKDLIEKLVKKGKPVRFTKDVSSSKDRKKYKSSPQKPSRPSESPKRKRSPNRDDTYPWRLIISWSEKKSTPKKKRTLRRESTHLYTPLWVDFQSQKYSPKEPIKSRMTKMLSIHSSEDTTLEKTSSGHRI